MKKLRSKRGETLVETLVAILVIALSASILAVMVSSSVKINYSANKNTAELYEQLSAAELHSGTAETDVTITDTGSGESAVCRVTVTGGDGELRSYALGGDGA